MNTIIETTSLTKHYGSVIAVQDLSLRVKQGEIYAFLGMNGAGKSTTIRMLLGMIAPTAGSATVLGTPVRMGRRTPWASVGYLLESPRAYPELTVRENLEVARRLHPGTSRQSIDQVIERLALGAYADRCAGELSQGNAQRLGLAKALLHKPAVLILDEPANGLDPAGIVEIRELLTELARSKGASILMSSHILAEVSRLAGRIGIIHRGRLLQEMAVDELERNRRKRLIVQARDLEKARSALLSARYQLEPNGTGSIHLRDQAALEHPDEVANVLASAGTPPTQLVIEEEGLEEYFLRLIGESGGN